MAQNGDKIAAVACSRAEWRAAVDETGTTRSLSHDAAGCRAFQSASQRRDAILRYASCAFRRLVVAVDFERSIVWIKWIGTHRDYDKIDVKEVQHDGD